MAELYRRYGKRLYRFGMQLLGDGELAEELVQECFTRLWRDAGHFDTSQGRVGGYLFAIARGSADGIRERLPPRPLPPAADDTGQILDSLVVREALDALSPAHRDVLRLAQITAGTFTVDRGGDETVTLSSGADPRRCKTMEITAESPGNGGQHGKVVLKGAVRGG